MKADEIMHVLRLTAMGRVNHPDQEVFCQKLEKVFADAAPIEPAPLPPAGEPGEEAGKDPAVVTQPASPAKKRGKRK